MLKKLLAGVFLKKKGIPFMNTNPKYSKFNIGIGTYGNPEIKFANSGNNFIVGNYCSIANGVKIMLGGEHRIDWVSTYPFNRTMLSASNIKGHPRSKGDVVIGNDVWIGLNTLVMSGVRIGNGAVIAANSTVVKDIPDYAIYGGNPAKFIKWRFSEEIIEKMNHIQWWNWSEQRIEDNVDLILSDDIGTFVKKFENGS